MLISKVCFIDPETPGVHIFARFGLPRLGIPILGAILKTQGIDVRVFTGTLREEDWWEIAKSDLIGISALTSTAPAAYAVLQRAKEVCAAPIVMGGPHATFEPEEALGHGADLVLRGEAEESLPELISSLNGDGDDLSTIAGLSYLQEGGGIRHNESRRRPASLSSFPWPDLSLLPGSELRRFIPLLTSRGCPHNCRFCQVPPMFGNRYRFRETDDVLAEMEKLSHNHPRGTFFIYDDNFTASPSRTKELLETMVRTRITPRWTAMARVEVARDGELLDLMKAANCAYLCLGLESVNPATLADYNKGQTMQDVRAAIRTLHGRGIRVHGMFVLGSDRDDVATVRDTLRFAKDAGLDTAQFMIATPLPGTPFFEQLATEGRLLGLGWEAHDGVHAAYSPKLMTPACLEHEVLARAMRKFYSPWRCLQAGLRLRGRDMMLRAYGHLADREWRRLNRSWLAELKKAYKQEVACMLEAGPKVEALEGGMES
jgi:radical SAM superfamily enzyme YgiQ (UPF0313 family)